MRRAEVEVNMYKTEVMERLAHAWKLVQEYFQKKKSRCNMANVYLHAN